MELKTLPIGIVGLNSNTVKSYLAIMKQYGLQPRSIILMARPLGKKAKFLSRIIGINNTRKLLNLRNSNKVKHLKPFQEKFKESFKFNFDFFCNVDFKNYCENYYEISSININDTSVIQCLKASKERVVIYGGGGIVKSPIFDLGIKIIHTHPGYLPFVRGSHGVFWSLLMRKKFGCSTFYMNDGIDLGEIIQKKEYPLSIFPAINEPENIIEALLNFYIDPLIRAKTLIDVLLNNSNLESLDVSEQNSDEGESYYFMQPELRQQIAAKLKAGSTC